jgi:hypothetical protein
VVELFALYYIPSTPKEPTLRQDSHCLHSTWTEAEKHRQWLQEEIGYYEGEKG